MRRFLVYRFVLMMVCVLLGAALLEARSDRRNVRRTERTTRTSGRMSAADTQSAKRSGASSKGAEERLADVYRPKNEHLPPEQQQHLKKVEVKADAFDKAVTRRSPRFKGEFTVGIVFVNFPDCEEVDVKACLARQSEGVADYYKRYTLGQCWPRLVVMGVYNCPNPLGYYVKRGYPSNLLGGSEMEVEARVNALWKEAFARYRGASQRADKVDVRVLAYATKILPVTSKDSTHPRSLEQLPELRKLYPVMHYAQSEDERRAVGFREDRDIDPLKDYNPNFKIGWGDPLWPNSRIIVKAEGGASTMIHELGHVLGAPDTYHAPQKDDGIPGHPVIAGGGPTAPLYCRYRYCGLLPAAAYPTLHQSTTVKLAPRWGEFDGKTPLGIFIPTEHPNYLLHLEYEPDEVQTFDNGPTENTIGKVTDSYSPRGGILIYYINVPQSDPYHGTPDLVYSYRKRDPYFRGLSAPDPNAKGGYQRVQVAPGRFRYERIKPESPLAVFREGDDFSAESDPANRLPNCLPTGVEITFGPQDETGAEVTVTVPTSRLSGQALKRSMLPVVHLEEPSELLPTSLRATLTVHFRGEEPYTDYGFCYAPTPNPTIKQGLWPLWGFSDWRDTTRITGLKPGSTLYVRAYAKNAYGVAYSPECHQVTLPKEVDEVPALLLDGYTVPPRDSHYDSEGYLYNKSGACALVKLMALFHHPVGKTSKKPDFNCQRLHLQPNNVLPGCPYARYSPTIRDLAYAYAWAISLAEEAGLYAGAFPEDFDARCTRALQLKPGPTRIPPDFATEARAVGLTPEQTRALLGPIVTLDEVTLPLLLPRIKASLVAGKPVLCVRTPTYDSRALYGVTTTLIDGYRPNAEDPSAPQLHLNFALHSTNDCHHSLRPDWFPLEALFKNSKGGKLVFLP
ncbi:MAG: hypothetical protein ACI4RT_02805 [Candidatus Spyradenecus sp.]